MAAAELGFTFHNAEGETAMLSLWLSTTMENKIPTFATHTIGVGGFVLNDAGEVRLPPSGAVCHVEQCTDATAGTPRRCLW